ncbi:MAG TPA: hypothetical protein PKC30_13325 [Saprospiraceae bacterium]|nr:hypothetical protein [Saprospiraceae bacterium]
MSMREDERKFEHWLTFLKGSKTISLYFLGAGLMITLIACSIHLLLKELEYYVLYPWLLCCGLLIIMINGYIIYYCRSLSLLNEVPNPDWIERQAQQLYSGLKSNGIILIGGVLGSIASAGFAIFQIFLPPCIAMTLFFSLLFTHFMVEYFRFQVLKDEMEKYN